MLFCKILEEPFLLLGLQLVVVLKHSVHPIVQFLISVLAKLNKIVPEELPLLQ